MSFWSLIDLVVIIFCLKTVSSLPSQANRKAGTGSFSWSPSNKLDDYFDVANYSFKTHYCTKLCNDKCSQEKGSKDRSRIIVRVATRFLSLQGETLEVLSFLWRSSKEWTNFGEKYYGPKRKRIQQSKSTQSTALDRYYEKCKILVREK